MSVLPDAVAFDRQGALTGASFLLIKDHKSYINATRI